MLNNIYFPCQPVQEILLWRLENLERQETLIEDNFLENASEICAAENSFYTQLLCHNC